MTAFDIFSKWPYLSQQTSSNKQTIYLEEQQVYRTGSISVTAFNAKRKSKYLINIVHDD